MTVTYEDYEPLVESFRKLYHEKYDGFVQLTANEVRLIYLALTASKANLKQFDPAKGLNQ